MAPTACGETGMISPARRHLPPPATSLPEPPRSRRGSGALARRVHVMCQPSDLDLRQSGFDHGFGDRACPAHIDEAAGPACEVPASHVRESARDGRAARHGQAGEGILGGEDLAVAAHEEQLGPSSLTRHMPGRTWPPRARLPRRSIRGSMMGWGAYWRGVLVSAAGRRSGAGPPGEPMLRADAGPQPGEGVVGEVDGFGGAELHVGVQSLGCGHAGSAPDLQRSLSLARWRPCRRTSPAPLSPRRCRPALGRPSIAPRPGRSA